ncbi:hypothetical protein Nepgr_027382 [Nepenthes gracilis]|uniref:Uncharacterized protein n=1 Tax=Nepenthes gracilis TaxID=150966 RepID=A0AAD3TA91_NEPGR|nr:hypothetical protein Nepgr_027382 [Nepenthes gracilis]
MKKRGCWVARTRSGVGPVRMGWVWDPRGTRPVLVLSLCRSGSGKGILNGKGMAGSRGLLSSHVNFKYLFSFAFSLDNFNG